MLKQRIISSVLLLSVLFACVCAGFPYFNLYFGVVISVMAWEWDSFINKKTTPLAVVYVALGIYFYARKKQHKNPMLLGFGAIYIALPALSLNIIITANSIAAIIWVLAISWACDTGGYVFGRLLKGPKLCPRITPKKTWAGFFGGLFLACVFSYAYTYFLDLDWKGVYVLSIALAVISVLGDLLESSIKRYMDVKDTSNIIPGHGGVFDRIDSTILVVVVFAILVVASDTGFLDMMIF